MSGARVYRLDVDYPQGSRYPDEGWMTWEPEGWDPPWNDDPEADLSFQWPRVRLYLSKAGAEARARLLRQYGATVTVKESDPVTWSDA